MHLKHKKYNRVEIFLHSFERLKSNNIRTCNYCVFVEDYRGVWCVMCNVVAWCVVCNVRCVMCGA